jgi:hypothetical protein
LFTTSELLEFYPPTVALQTVGYWMEPPIPDFQGTK